MVRILVSYSNPFRNCLRYDLRLPAVCATAALQDPCYGLKAAGSGSQYARTVMVTTAITSGLPLLVAVM